MQKPNSTVNSLDQSEEKTVPDHLTGDGAFSELEQVMYTALETYSNVHRGSGHNSKVTTQLFEQARQAVLDYLDLERHKYGVIFCTPNRSDALIKFIKPGSYQLISSHELGLVLGVRALVIERKALPGGTPFQTGGGTAKLVASDWIIWAGYPEKFEAGTPAIINIIAFARALLLMKNTGINTFRGMNPSKLSAADILYHDVLEEYSGLILLDELRQTLIGRGVMVPTSEGARPYINLDNAASTPAFFPIWEAFRHTWSQSRQVQLEIIHEVRSICAGFLGAPLETYDLIFTSNTTEALNLAAQSLGIESNPESDTVVLNTLLEHNSNELPWRVLPNVSMIRQTVDAEGFLDLDELEAILSAYNQKSEHGRKSIRLVAVSGASNVLGVFNNLEEIARIVHHYGARLLVDAAQLVAHRKTDMEKWGIDYLAFSAHKVYAPFGSGALVFRKGLLHFSHKEMEQIKASGEENAGGIAALGKSLVLLQRIGLDLILAEEQDLTAKTLNGLALIPGLRIYGTNNPDSPAFASRGGVIVFSLKNMMPDKLAGVLAEKGGIGVRYGCHCSHMLVKHLLHVSPGIERFQRVLLTLFPRINLPGVVRVSLGIENTEEDIDKLLMALNRIVMK